MKNFWLIFFVIALIEFFVVKILVCCFRKAVIFLRTQRNIYKRKDGRWEGRYFKEYDKNGKIKYASVYAKTYNDVKNKLDIILLNQKKCKIKNVQNRYFKDFCLEWISIKKHYIKQSSYSKYYFQLDKYIIPCFGKLKILEIDRVSTEQLYSLNNQLSLATIRQLKTVLKSIISYINDKYGYQISFKDFKFHNSVDKKINVLSVSEQLRLERFLLSNLDLTKLGVYLCLYTGLRIGELCALKWSDIDLNSNVLSINKSMQRIQNIDKNYPLKTKIVIEAPKSKNSIREIPLTDYVVECIKKVSDDQTKYSANLYFLTGNEKYMEPRTLQYRFKNYLEEAGVDYVNFHTLRHTFATRAIEKGINVKSVSEILGHSTVKMTLEKYVHITMEQKLKDINKLNSFV